jgi:hypothetical protein
MYHSKSRTNRELEEMNKRENIVKCIKGQRINWLGHLERMEDRMTKKIFTQELEGTRRRGRPRKRWKGEVGGGGGGGRGGGGEEECTTLPTIKVD